MAARAARTRAGATREASARAAPTRAAAGEPTPPAELCDRLRAAADRLLAGTPLHSDGKLTILSLAQEAGIKRWLLTHKHPHQLQAKYQAEFKAAQHKPAPVHAADREIERLRGELSKARDDRLHHEQLTRAYALIINQLTEELEATKAERDALLDTPAIARLPRRLPI